MSDRTTAVGEGDSRTDDERWHLNDQREFLLRSLADAQSEHNAGDLSDEDFALLTDRDRQKLDEVEQELERLAPVSEAGGVGDVESGQSGETGEAGKAGEEGEEGEAPKMSRWRLAGILASCALIVAGVIILVDHALAPRANGQATSGSVTQSKQQLVEQQLAQAATLNNEGHTASALVMYGKVLSEDPYDPVALAESGWLYWNEGATDGSTNYETLGQESEQAAIHESPDFYAPHLYLGLILYYQHHEPTAAVAQFNKFLADDPPSDELAAVAPRLKGVYEAAKVPVPASLTAASG